MIRRRIRTAVLLAAASLAVGPRLSGQSVSWVNPINGDWLDGPKWTGGMAPTASVYSAVLDTTGPSYTVTLTSSFSLGNLAIPAPGVTLAMQGATMQIPTGGLVENAGTMSLSSSYFITSTIGGSTFSNSGWVTLNSGRATKLAMDNSGTIICNGGPCELYRVMNTGRIEVNDNYLQFGAGGSLGGTLAVATSGVAYIGGANWNEELLSIEANATIAGGGRIAFSGENVEVRSPWNFAGITSVGDAGYIALGFKQRTTFTNSIGAGGAFTVDAGTANFLGTVSRAILVQGGTANFMNSVAAPLTIAGGTVNAFAPYTGSLSYTSGTLNLSAPAILTGTSSFGGNPINFSFPINIDGSLNWTSGGTIADIDISHTGTATVSAGASTTAFNGNISNAGSMQIEGIYPQVRTGTTWTNTGTISLSGAYLTADAIGAATFQNSGTLALSSGRTTRMALNNTGTILVQGGPCEVYRAANTGLIRIDAGYLQFGAGGSIGGTLSIGSSGIAYVGGANWNNELLVLEPSVKTIGDGTIAFSGENVEVRTPWSFAGKTFVGDSQYASLGFKQLTSFKDAINPGGTFVVNAGTAEFDAPVNRAIHIQGGIANFTSDVNAALSLSGGIAHVTGNLNAPVSLVGGNLTLSGIANVPITIQVGSASLSGNYAGGVSIGAATVNLQGATVNRIMATGGVATVQRGSSLGTGNILGGQEWKIVAASTLVVEQPIANNQASVVFEGASAAFDSLSGVSQNSGSLTLDGANWPLGTAGALNNSGQLTRTGSGGTFVPNTRTISNSGTITVSGGTMVIGSSSNLTPAINPTTLTGGSWIVSYDGWLGFGGAAGNGGTITSLASNTRVVLDGLNAQMPALNLLTSNSGTLEVRGGKAFFNGLTLTNNGTLSVGAASEWLSLGGISSSGGTILLSSDNASPGVFRLSGQFLVPAVGPSLFGSAILSTGNGSLAGSIDMMNKSGVFNVANVFTAPIDLDVSANLTNGNLTKSGSGVMRISGVNSYQGATTINAGTLLLGANATLPQASSVVMTSGSSLDLAGYNQTIESLSGTGTILLGGASLTVAGISSTSFNGTISGNGAFRKTGSGTLIYNGALNQNGPLTVTNGLLQLGSSANYFTGSINISGGALSTTSDLALGDPLFQPNGINLSGGTFLYGDTTSRNVSIAGNSTIGSLGAATFSGPISGNGTLNFTGISAGTITLNGTNNFAGAVNITGVNAKLVGGVARLPNVPVFRVNVGASLDLDRTSPGAGPLASGPLGSGGMQDVRLNGGTLLVRGQDSTNINEDFGTLFLDGGASTIQTIPGAGGTLTLNFGSFGPRGSGATVNWIAANPGVNDRIRFDAGVPSGFIGSYFTVNGTDFAKYDTTLGVLPFAPADYNTGFVRDTHVLLNAAAAVPDTTLNPPDPFNIRTLNLVSTGSLDVSIPATTTLQLSEGGLIKSGAGTSTISGGTLTWGGSELNISVSGGTLDISSTISRTGAGTFTLTKRGTGTLALSGSNASNYSGVTMISGAMQLNKPAGTNAIPGNLLISGGVVTSQANEQIADAGIVTLNAGTFDLNGKTETIAQLINNNGTVLFNGGTLNSTSTTLNGGTTTVASTLNASTTLTITGGKNTVSTTGIVNVGTLNLSGASSASIELASGAGSSGQLILSGNVSASPSTGTLKIISTGVGATPGKLDLGGAVRTFTIASGSAREDLFVSAQVISGGIIKTGPGMMQMSGANTYTQGTAINSGTLEGTSTTAFGSGSIQFGVGTTTVGTLGLRSDASVATFGNAIAAGGTARPIFVDIDRLNPGSGTKFVLGTATLGSNLTITGAGTLQVSSIALSTTAVINPYGTTLVISGGIHGAGQGVIFGGAAASPGSILPGSGGSNSGDPIGTIILNGSTPSSNTGSITVGGPSPITFLALDQTPGQYAIVGPLNLINGTVFCMQGDQFDHSVNVSMTTPGGLFNLNGTVQTIHDLTLQSGEVQTNGGTLNVTGTISTPPLAGGLPEGSSTPTPANVSIQGNLSLAPGTAFNLTSASDQLTLDATISALGGFTLNGAGQLNLNGTNTIGGVITLNGGTINAATSGSMGTATIVLNGGILNSNGSIANRIVLGASGGQINVPLLQTLTINQPLSGAGLSKTGAGTLILSGANTFSGNINLSAGTLQIANDGNLGSLSNPVNLNGGNLTYSQNLSTTRALNLNGGAIAVAANQAVSLDGSTPLTGTGGLIKTGPGTLSINRPRSYQGATQVSGGTLNFAVQPVELLAGGTLNGGVWIVEANSTLNMTGPAISTNKASVTLRGANSNFTNLANFNRNEGNFTVEAGRSFTTSSAFTNTGTTTVGSSGGLKVINTLSNSGTIDLSGAMVIDYSTTSPIAGIKAQVLSGYAAGTWRGIGVNSSAAAGDARRGIAVAEATEAGLSFSQIATDSSCVILLLTTRGDTNLDSQVNSLDFNRFAANYGKANGIWSEGDFNYDTKINTADFNYLAGNFGAGLGTLPVPGDLQDSSDLPGSNLPSGTTVPDVNSGLGTVVPEPAALLRVGAVGMLLLRRKRISETASVQPNSIHAI